jgi:clan AA aspartic protease (TIGR02281 family)
MAIKRSRSRRPISKRPLQIQSASESQRCFFARTAGLTGPTSDMHESGRHAGRAPNWIPALLAGLLLASTLAVTTGEAASLATELTRLGYQEIELRRTGENHLFLFARVNGRRRSCLVDTGWSLTTVSTNTARWLTSPDNLGDLKLGRVTLTNEQAVVRDLRVNGQPTAFDLVLGCDFLIRHHAVIDCAGRRLYLRREALANESMSELAALLRGRGFVALDLKQHDPLALTCKAQLNGRDVAMLVDTGAMWSCLDTETAQAAELRVDPSASQITGAAATGKCRLSVTRVARFEIGGWQRADVNLAVLALADWGLGPSGQLLNGVGGILGGDQLLANTAVIDCGQLKLWLRDRK